MVCFILNENFGEDDLRKMVLENASKEDMAKVAAGLRFGEKNKRFDYLAECNILL